ncbi:unnamed protein product [Moneuplotes crassus]|uniref:Uncharacterized protein n=1 Tax=Euplotes crassus TaxID=5936 RepID=A0AAD1XLN8_EUPCR|nr:unnamed protein product [Moneuplotes crassus]
MYPSSFDEHELQWVDDNHNKLMSILHKLIYIPVLGRYFNSTNVFEISLAAWLRGIFALFYSYIVALFSEFDYGFWELDVLYWKKKVTVHTAIAEEKGFDYYHLNEECIRSRIVEYFLPLYNGTDSSNCSEIDPIIINLSERPIDPVESYASLIWKILLFLSILCAIIRMMKLIMTEWKTYKSLSISPQKRCVEILDESSSEVRSISSELSNLQDQGSANSVNIGLTESSS